MKQMVLLLCACLLCAQEGQPPTLSQQIEKLWLQGHKDKVGEIAQQRLKIDPNDIIGLVLSLEYELAFVKTDQIPATLDHIEEVGKKITSSNFKDAWPQAQSLIGLMREVLKHYTSKQIEIDRKKASISGKPMLFLFLLEAAERDELDHQRTILKTS